MKSSFKSLLIWVFKANLAIWLINFLLFAVLSLSSSWAVVAFSGYFSKITLLETGLFFLIAGAIAFSGSASSSKTKELLSNSDERWSIEKLRRSERKANNYLILATILFIEAILVSLFGF